MTSEQRRLYQAALAIGRRFGVGGVSSWTYTPPVANTPAASANTGATSTRTAYIVRARLVAVGQAAPAAPAPAEQYRLIGVAGQTFAAGATLSTTGYAFRLGPVDTDQGYPTGVVERL